MKVCGESMNSIRYNLLADDQDQKDWRSGLGIILFCLMLSVWVHLVGFIIWQSLDQNVGDNFVFELQPENPPLELTLVFNEPLTPLDMASEIYDAGSSSPYAAEDLAAGGPDSGFPDADKDILTAMVAALPEINSEVTESELLPLNELDDPTPINPEPPIRVEGEAPERKSYYMAIRMAVNHLWIMPPAAKTRFRPGRLTVDFTIGRSGELLRWVVIESTGNTNLDHAGLEAIRSAAPFPPFPDDLKQFSQLDIRMHFDYKAQYLPRQTRTVETTVPAQSASSS